MTGQNSSKDFSGVKVNLKAGEVVEQYALFDVDSKWVGENLHVLGIVTALNPSGDAFTVNNVVDCPVNASVPFSYK